MKEAMNVLIWKPFGFPNPQRRCHAVGSIIRKVDFNSFIATFLARSFSVYLNELQNSGHGSSGGAIFECSDSDSDNDSDIWTTTAAVVWNRSAEGRELLQCIVGFFSCSNGYIWNSLITLLAYCYALMRLLKCSLCWWFLYSLFPWTVFDTTLHCFPFLLCFMQYSEVWAVAGVSDLLTAEKNAIALHVYFSKFFTYFNCCSFIII